MGSMALVRKHLNVAASSYDPWVALNDSPDGSVRAGGIAGGILNIITAVMNFTYTVKKPPNGEWGRELPNGSFTGMIGMCQRKEVDMALGPFAMSWDRYQAADFSTLIHFDDVGILVPRPRREIDFTGPTRPLAWQVWISLLIVIFISGVFIFATKHLMNYGMMKNSLKKEETMQLSWITRVMLAETVDHLPKKNMGRIFLMSWMIVGVVIHAAYSGVLTSLLAVPKVIIPVNSLQDLLTYGKIPWIFERGGIVHDTFLKTETELYKGILDGGTIVASFHSIREKVVKERLSAFIPLISIKKFLQDEYTAHGKCEFYVAKNPVLSVPFTMAFPKGSQVKGHFNKWINKLKESGMVSNMILKSAKNATACLVPPGKEEGGQGGRHTPFTVMDLAPVFLLYGAGVLISIITLLLEGIVYERQ